MAELRTRVIQAAARLWGKPENQVHLRWRSDLHTAEVYVWVNDDDPDEGSLSRQVFIRPPPGVDAITDVAYRTEILLALLDILEGALKRKEASGALATRSFN